MPPSMFGIELKKGSYPIGEEWEEGQSREPDKLMSLQLSTMKLLKFQGCIINVTKALEW